MPEWLAGCGAMAEPAIDNHSLQFCTSELNHALAQLAQVCSAHGVRITDLRAGRGRLEALIVRLSAAKSRGHDT